MSEFATQVLQIRDVIYRVHAKMVIDMKRDHSEGSIVQNCIGRWGHNTVEMGGAFVILIITHYGKDEGEKALGVLRKAAAGLLKTTEELINLVRGESGLPIALIVNNACKERALGIVSEFERSVRERTLDS